MCDVVVVSEEEDARGEEAWSVTGMSAVSQSAHSYADCLGG